METIASLCAKFQTAECEPTWSAAMAETTYCAEPEEEQDYACDDYRVRFLDDLDEHTLSFYDSAGMLTAVLLSGMGPTDCIGGPGTFTPPAGCEAPGTFKNCSDAGVEAGP
jgi:hypothetical protein